MNQSVEINGKSFVPVRLAAQYFNYSRDHITRLAKSKKINATQIGRLWFVDQGSLKNYFDDQQTESEIRKSILSKNRQRELQVRSALSSTHKETSLLANKSTHVATVAACLLFALLFAVTSQVVPTFATSAAALGSLTQSSVIESGESAVVVQPVFTDGDHVFVINADRWVEKPEVTPEWVQVTP